MTVCARVFFSLFLSNHETNRFRTCFPKEYRKPNDLESEEDTERIPGPAPESDAIAVAPLPPKTPKIEGEKSRKKTTKTELHHVEVLEKLGVPNSFPKVQRRERREFTVEEDARLLHGFNIVCIALLYFSGYHAAYPTA